VKERNEIIEGFDKTPSVSQLFSFVKELVVRIDKLENENAKLKQVIHIAKRKLDICEWLNQNKKPSIVFTKWLTEIPYHSFLHSVFQHDLIYGMVACLYNGNGCSLPPICAFSEKTNGFYVYDEYVSDGTSGNQWIFIAGNEFDKWLNYIANCFLIEFKKWCDEHKNEIDNNEDMKETYYSNFQKVLGNSKITVDVRNQRVRNQYYHKLKQSYSG